MTNKLSNVCNSLGDESNDSASVDETIRLRDLNKKLYVGSFSGHSNYNYSLIQSTDGKMASVYGNQTIKICDIKTCLCNST